MTIIDRRYSVAEGTAIKAPCRVATTADITLSGLQTLDGITLAENDRVLVKDQSDGSQNGIYSASSGNWSRTKDFDGAYDVVTGSRVYVSFGTVGAHTEYAVTTTGDIVIDETSIAFGNSAPIHIAPLTAGPGGISVTINGSLQVTGGALAVAQAATQSNKWISSFDASGLPVFTQPAIGNISGLGTGVATFLATPSSANLRSALTDESGSAAAYFQGGDLGTPSAGVGTNLTSLNASSLASGTVAAARGGAGTINGALKGNGSGVVSQAATADISDCSTGTWTPAVTTTGTAGTPTYSANNNGSYVKIGTLVVAWFRLQTTAWTGSPTGNLGFSGLPFANTSATQNFGVCTVSQYTASTGAGTNGVFGSIAASATTGTFFTASATGTQNIDASTVGTAISFIGVCVYHT